MTNINHIIDNATIACDLYFEKDRLRCIEQSGGIYNTNDLVKCFYSWNEEKLVLFPNQTLLPSTHPHES